MSVSLSHRFVFQILLFCASWDACFAIFAGARTDDAPPPVERIAREPMPFFGFPSPMMQGPPGGYAGRAGGSTNWIGGGGGGGGGSTAKPKYNETTYQYSYQSNDTKIYESEYYEPNYCEYILIEELTRAVNYLVIFDLEGKFGKLKKKRYAVKTTAIIPELVYTALYEGYNLEDTIAKGLKEQYAFIPGAPSDAVKKYEAERFEAKVKYAIKDVLKGICRQSYCCLESNEEYYASPNLPTYGI